MNTLLRYTALAALTGILAYAAGTASTPPAPVPAVTCEFMSNRTLGSAKGPQWIRCTAETMRTDVRCRELCAAVKR